jgi:hypothetical protein
VRLTHRYVDDARFRLHRIKHRKPSLVLRTVVCLICRIAFAGTNTTSQLVGCHRDGTCVGMARAFQTSMRRNLFVFRRYFLATGIILSSQSLTKLKKKKRTGRLCSGPVQRPICLDCNPGSVQRNHRILGASFQVQDFERV